MAPTPRAACGFFVVAVAALVVPPALAALAAIALAGAVVVDALSVRQRPSLEKDIPKTLVRGRTAAYSIRATNLSTAIRLRQPAPAGIEITPQEAERSLTGTVLARTRGHVDLPGPADRTTGPLKLGRWYHGADAAHQVLVYPDLPAARRLALQVRLGLLRNPGSSARGPFGLGTDFESIRDYTPDDDIRQVNWRATARTGRPMSNQFRIEQDRDVLLLIDAGRLMSAPLGDRDRLDAALDAATAMALVADELGDHCGALAFDSRIRARLPAKRKNGRAVIDALFDLHPTRVESNYELAFRSLDARKRSLVVVFTDLFDEAAADSLLDAVPVIARRHAVIVAGAEDPDLAQIVAAPIQSPYDGFAVEVAKDVLASQRAVIARLSHAGVRVVEAPPDRLGARCVDEYLAVKSRARL
ncbi:MAG: DUF58 domain-containing protein [Actinomycetota bacterium]